MRLSSLSCFWADSCVFGSPGITHMFSPRETPWSARETLAMEVLDAIEGPGLYLLPPPPGNQRIRLSK